MNIRRKCFAVLLILVLLLSMAGTVSASKEEDAAEYIRQIVRYYGYHGDNAKNDINCLTYALNEVDPAQAQAWSSIMEYWSYVNTDMTIYPGVLPDGLPDSNALCIVVLGYGLNDDGTMRNELVGRLKVALQSAVKYPNALIVCTGGATAEFNKHVTEAGQMAQWLRSCGIDKNRIIVEDQSYSTVSNARNTCRILLDHYPQVTHLALITSDYHLPRASLLFHAELTLLAQEEHLLPLCVAANAAYDTSRDGYESFKSQLSDLQQLTGVNITGLEEPPLSKLDSIVVSGSAQYTPGEDLNWKVMAYYDTGLYRDVTRRVTYTDIDQTKAGMQDVTVTYEEGGLTASATVQIEVLIPETEPPAVAPTKASVEAPTTQPAAKKDTGISAINRWLLASLIVIAVLLLAETYIIIRLITLKIQEKAAKAAAKKEEEDAKLPDDDSPLEYI